MLQEEIEKQARERAEKLKEEQTLGIYYSDEDLARDIGWNDGEVSGYEKGFKEGAKWGQEEISKKILEKAKKIWQEDSDYFSDLEGIIKNLGIKL